MVNILHIGATLIIEFQMFEKDKNETENECMIEVFAHHLSLNKVGKTEAHNGRKSNYLAILS